MIKLEIKFKFVVVTLFFIYCMTIGGIVFIIMVSIIFFKILILRF